MAYADPAAQKARNKRYYESHRAVIKARAASWRAANPERDVRNKRGRYQQVRRKELTERDWGYKHEGVYLLTRWRELGKAGGVMPYALPAHPDSTWVYMAGLVDGEGSIHMGPRGKRPQPWMRYAEMSIVSTDRGMLQWAVGQLHCGYIYDSNKKVRGEHPGRRRCFTLQVHRLAVIRAVFPKLLEFSQETKKRGRINDVLTWLESEYACEVLV